MTNEYDEPDRSAREGDGVMPQGSPSKRDQQPENIREDSESSSQDRRPSTALGEVLHEVEEAETRVGDDDERRRKDGESGDAMTPNEKEQEHGEPGGASA